jgi:transcriptional regulator with XRE-family HTH domain
VEDIRDTHTRVPLPYLRAWRQRAGLSRSALAQRAHIGESTIARIELAAGRANPLAVARLAAGLGISAERLVRDPASQMPHALSREDTPS